jgi:hypothetical protein
LEALAIILMNQGQDGVSSQSLIRISQRGVDHFQERHLRGDQQQSILALGYQSFEEPGVSPNCVLQMTETGVFRFQGRDPVAELPHFLRIIGQQPERFR